jgi:proteasome lid subunit RPN8/RPN11
MRIENDIVFNLNKDIISKLNKCIHESSPNEACGFFFGDITESNHNGDFRYTYSCEKIQCIESRTLNPVSFLIDNDEKMLELSNIVIKKERLKLIAVFHSHPSGANPSSVDKKCMRYYHNCGIKKFTHLVWIIVDSSSQKINGFLYLNNKLTQIKIVVS